MGEFLAKRIELSNQLLFLTLKIKSGGRKTLFFLEMTSCGFPKHFIENEKRRVIRLKLFLLLLKRCDLLLKRNLHRLRGFLELGHFFFEILKRCFTRLHLRVERLNEARSLLTGKRSDKKSTS